MLVCNRIFALFPAAFDENSSVLIQLSSLAEKVIPHLLVFAGKCGDSAGHLHRLSAFILYLLSIVIQTVLQQLVFVAQVYDLFVKKVYRLESVLSSQYLTCGCCLFHLRLRYCLVANCVEVRRPMRCCQLLASECRSLDLADLLLEEADFV